MHGFTMLHIGGTVRPRAIQFFIQGIIQATHGLHVYTFPQRISCFAVINCYIVRDFLNVFMCSLVQIVMFGRRCGFSTFYMHGNLLTSGV